MNERGKPFEIRPPDRFVLGRMVGRRFESPSERLVLWLYEADDPGSRVELRLVAVPDGTRVTVTEAPVGPFAMAGAA